MMARNELGCSTGAAAGASVARLSERLMRVFFRERIVNGFTTQRGFRVQGKLGMMSALFGGFGFQNLLDGIDVSMDAVLDGD